jgi:hypothetical protein
MAGLARTVDDAFSAEIKAMYEVTIPQTPGAPMQHHPLGIVRVMNVSPIQNSTGSFGFWSFCGVGDLIGGQTSGSIARLDTTQWGTLVIYTSTQPRTGINGPSGTIFILEDQQLQLPFLLNYENVLPIH